MGRWRVLATSAWAVTLLILMSGPNFVPAISLVCGLSLGVLVAILWKRFTLKTALLTISGLSVISSATFLTFGSNPVGWNCAFGCVALVGIWERRRNRPGAAIANVILSGGLAICLGAVAGILIRWRMHPAQLLDWEGLAWLPFILLGAGLVPLLVFLAGCAMVEERRQDRPRP
jgi:hypothetical protein